jgi:ubiquinol-cytochrome c reductase cytochrome b subunit
MLSFVWKWFTSKWPFYPLKRLLLDEEIPGGASFAYTLGSALLIVFSIQAVSGIIQLFYYVPSVDHAYDSVSYLRTEVPFGWLIHNVHYWGASIMVVLIALHMIRVYIWGAYKTQLTWLIGVALVITVMALTQTGAPMLWDQKGFWAGEVSTSIPGTFPIVGEIVKRIARGGESMGQLTLSRFFVLHVAILVPALVALIAMHIAAFRTSGVAGPWDEGKRKTKGPFWPDQMFKDTIVATTVVFILLSLCVFFPPPFSGPADPSNTTYLPKPEWNFLFLYQALKYFEGPLEPVGAAGVPGVLVTLLVLLPFIDRNPQRNPYLRPVAMISLAVYAGLLIALTVIGYLSPGFAQMPGTLKKTAASTAADSRTGRPVPKPVPEQTGPVSISGNSVGAGLYESQGCGACHGSGGKGGSIGPALAGGALAARDRKWLEDQIRNPKSHFPNTIMPAFTSLSDRKIGQLIDYLLSIQVSPDKTSSDSASPVIIAGEVSGSASDKLPGRASYTIGNAENGGILFEKNCAACHGHKAIGGIPNPGSDDGTVPPLNPIDRELFHADPRIFAGNIDKFIQHGSMPDGPHPAIHMLPFGDSHSLTQQEISNIEAYVLQLNGVDRAQLINPGIQPRRFYVLTVLVFGIAALVLGGIWNKKFGRGA